MPLVSSTTSDTKTNSRNRYIGSGPLVIEQSAPMTYISKSLSVLQQEIGKPKIADYGGVSFMKTKRLHLNRKQVSPGYLEAVATLGPVKPSTLTYWWFGPGNDGFTTVVFTSPNVADGLTKAQIDCLEKASDVKGNLAVTIAEANKTMSMIGSVAKRVASGVLQLKRGNVLGAWKTLAPSVAAPKKVKDRHAHRARSRNAWKIAVAQWQAKCRAVKLENRKNGTNIPFPPKPSEQRFISREAVDNDWLMVQYGIKPLLADAANLAEMAAQRFVGHPKIFSVSSQLSYNGRAWSKTKTPYLVLQKTVVNGFLNHGTGAPGFSIDYSLLESKSVAAGLTLQVQSPAFQTLNQVVGNPLVVVHELIPLSFVADWFLDIGGYLERMTALNGLSVLDGYTTQVVTTRGLSSVSAILDSDWHISSNTPATQDEHDFDRAVWNGQAPSFLAGAPLLSNLSVAKLISAVALIRQRL